MKRTISHSIESDDGAVKSIIIEPVMTQATNDKLNFSGVYTLYNDPGLKKADFPEIQEIAPEIGESKPLLDDKNNPDFLGQIVFENSVSDWEYKKGSLSAHELGQIVSFIQNSGN